MPIKSYLGKTFGGSALPPPPLGIGMIVVKMSATELDGCTKDRFLEIHVRKLKSAKRFK